MSPHPLSVRGPALFAALASLALLSLTGPAPAQQPLDSGLPVPRLMALLPAGGKAGTTFELTLGGLNLEDPDQLLFSTPGIKAELVGTPPAPIDPKSGKPKKGMATATPGILKYKVTLPADAPLGLQDVRVVNKWGVSNPRAFFVGDLPEVLEKEPNNDDAQAQKIEINSTVHGSFANPTDVDYFAFTGKKGQRVLLSCLASSIDSRAQPTIEVYDPKDHLVATNRNYSNNDALADCTLPADGEYKIRLFQFTHTFGQAVPLPNAIPPGLSDHHYRLSVTTAPWIDAIFPNVVEPGKAATVAVYGRNLPGGKHDPADPMATLGGLRLDKIMVNITPPAAPEARTRLAYSGPMTPAMAPLDGFEYRVRNDSGASNPYLLTFATAPVAIDNGDNDTAAKAQAIALPCEIAGKVEKRRDRDWYAFTAKKGEHWNIEVMSNRLGAPTYMYILLRNPATKGEIYESPLNDPPNQYDRRFFARSEDPPAYHFTAPADGTYHLLVANRTGDTTGGYGPRSLYRVKITKEQPDFHLVAVPAGRHAPEGVTIPAGGDWAFTVYAFREEGFADDIELTAEGLPPGVTCPAQIINGNVRYTTLVFRAARAAAPSLGEIRIKGTANWRGKKVTREARPGGIVWPVQPQQNQITRSRMERNLVLAVRGEAPFALSASLDKSEVAQGDKAVITVKQDRLWADFKTPLQVGLYAEQGGGQNGELPQNLRVNNNQPITLAPTAKDGTLAVAIGPDVPPGAYNIVLRGQGQAPYNKDPMAKAKQPTNVVQTASPVTLMVLPKALATLTVSNASPTVKAGGQVEVVVKVARKYSFDGEFQVQLVVPAGVAGVVAQPVTIPPGADEAKLIIAAQSGAAPGNRGNLTVKAVALFNGKVPTPHELKINVNVTK
jgi:hypothetical protein